MAVTGHKARLVAMRDHGIPSNWSDSCLMYTRTLVRQEVTLTI